MFLCLRGGQCQWCLQLTEVACTAVSPELSLSSLSPSPRPPHLPTTHPPHKLSSHRHATQGRAVTHLQCQVSRRLSSLSASTSRPTRSLHSSTITTCQHAATGAANAVLCVQTSYRGRNTVGSVAAELRSRAAAVDRVTLQLGWPASLLSHRAALLYAHCPQGTPAAPHACQHTASAHNCCPTPSNGLRSSALHYPHPPGSVLVLLPHLWLDCADELLDLPAGHLRHMRRAQHIHARAAARGRGVGGIQHSCGIADVLRQLLQAGNRSASRWCDGRGPALLLELLGCC